MRYINSIDIVYENEGFLYMRINNTRVSQETINIISGYSGHPPSYPIHQAVREAFDHPSLSPCEALACKSLISLDEEAPFSSQTLIEAMTKYLGAIEKKPRDYFAKRCELLLQNKQLDFSKDSLEEVIKLLDDMCYKDPMRNQYVNIHLINSFFDLDVLNNEDRLNEMTNANGLLSLALKAKNRQAVFKVLQLKSVDPSINGNYAILWASREGFVELVNLLLEDERTDPSAYNNFAVRMACKNGHAAIVELLLRHPKVDPSVNQNAAIKEASEKGYTKIVELLLTHPKVDPSVDDNWALKVASEKGYREIVRLLIVDRRVISTLRMQDIQYVTA